MGFLFSEYLCNSVIEKEAWNAMEENSSFIWKYNAFHTIVGYGSISTCEKEYIIVDGIAVRNKSDSELAVITDSSYIKVLRSSFINKANYEGSIVRLTGNSHHVLLEDCWIAGSGRYGIIIFKPTSTVDEAPHQIILRRCVVRHDYRRRDLDPTGGQVYPVKGIQIYGAQSGDTSTLVTREIMVQNCIVLDNNYGDQYYQNEGGMGSTARVNDLYFYGNIVLNIRGIGVCLPPPWGCSYSSTFAGYAVGGSRLNDGGGFTFKDNVAWDVSRYGIVMNGGDNELKVMTVSKCTIGDISNLEYSGGRGFSNVYSNHQITVSNNLFHNTQDTNPGFGPDTLGSFVEDNNIFSSTNLVGGYSTNEVLSNATITSIVYSPHENYGARILFRYGIDGSLWGDPGFDQLSTVPLWPWPYEDELKLALSEDNPSHNNSFPRTHNSKRGFCADGVTLSSYIWEYLGYPCPEEYCVTGNYGPSNNFDWIPIIIILILVPLFLLCLVVVIIISIGVIAYLALLLNPKDTEKKNIKMNSEDDHESVT